MEEEWRAVWWAERYEVSNLGNVRSNKRASVGAYLLKRTLGNRGYETVMIYPEDTTAQPVRAQVHSLVAAAFLGPRPTDHQVNHKDGVKTNNRVDNLEYVTRSENIAHGHRTGLIPNDAFKKAFANGTLDASARNRKVWESRKKKAAQE